MTLRLGPQQEDGKFKLLDESGRAVALGTLQVPIDPPPPGAVFTTTAWLLVESPPDGPTPEP